MADGSSERSHHKERDGLRAAPFFVVLSSMGVKAVAGPLANAVFGVNGMT